ncbi:hypothetical protein AJ78_05525 [Emergomyces pasteurianus Ep9510]|uniref:Methionyl/Leucyl tRNA synthetase domain-containing protein n=1 Tax=Emergomyces pasteurianus Ep9510 TaxID=1447872 RepID=A0A1J9PC50_9EURO|nr:hypothetical protein AJ78_05525 [Emergomyces pasteurianus Ep9510]
MYRSPRNILISGRNGGEILKAFSYIRSLEKTMLSFILLSALPLRSGLETHGHKFIICLQQIISRTKVESFPSLAALVFSENSAQQTGVPADVWRYYLLSRRPETGDTEFSWDSFISANNSILLNNLGNFVSRVLKFVNSRFYNNIVPGWTKYHESSFKTWKENINVLLIQYVEELNAVKLRAGLATALRISQQETSKSICTQLRMEPLAIPDHWSADTIKPSHGIGKSEHLFHRIQPEKAQIWRKMFGSDEVQKMKNEEAAIKTKKSSVVKVEKDSNSQSTIPN